MVKRERGEGRLKETGWNSDRERERKKRIRYKGNTVPTTPVWKLSYKNHIQGQEEQSIMLVLIAIYTKKKRNKNYYDAIAPKFSSPYLLIYRAQSRKAVKGIAHTIAGNVRSKSVKLRWCRGRESKTALCVLYRRNRSEWSFSRATGCVDSKVVVTKNASSSLRSTAALHIKPRVNATTFARRVANHRRHTLSRWNKRDDCQV